MAFTFNLPQDKLPDAESRELSKFDFTGQEVQIKAVLRGLSAGVAARAIGVPTLSWLVAWKRRR